ncbi:hypothetical protein ACIO14_18725 [Nocardia fluminea]|uniref:hypothetical protein n=1 Tax=Nocardia fluminea TaxID=134984 RepID=UPI0038183043
MTADAGARWLMIAVGVFAAIGVIDAATGGNKDLVVVFGAIIALSAAAALRLSSGNRRSIRVRADLARWLAIRAADGDERIGTVADRAVAAYRSGLTSDRETS